MRLHKRLVLAATAFAERAGPGLRVTCATAVAPSAYSRRSWLPVLPQPAAFVLYPPPGEQET